MLISAERTVLFLKKRMISIVILSALVLMAASVTLVQAEQQRLSAKLIRLHVVANSDSAHDQAVKLEVRDAVSAAAKALLDGAEHLRVFLDGAHVDRAHLADAVADAAAARLRELGEDLPVTVRLGKERFPTREYDTFSLPAGVYESLRVTIGAGKGHNWWCVVFPSLCLTSSMDELELAAQTAGFSIGEIRLITGEEDFRLKFRVLELLQQLKCAIAGA